MISRRALLSVFYSVPVLASIPAIARAARQERASLQVDLNPDDESAELWVQNMGVTDAFIGTHVLASGETVKITRHHDLVRFE